MEIFKDKDRPVFTLNRVVNRSYNNSLKCCCFSIYIVQIKINRGKEEIRIVQYPLLKVVVAHTLDEAKKNRWSLRYSFVFISYTKNKWCKEVLKVIKNHILINGIFILI
jgi:hypothetical protein